MYRVKFLLDGGIEDQRDEKDITDALGIAADWAQEARDDYYDGSTAEVQVIVEEVTPIASFFCKP